MDAILKAKIDEMLACLGPVAMDYLREAIPKNDKRATAYRVRLTLFKNGVLEADSDPELPANTAGTETIRGLLEVGKWAREIAYGFHYGEGPGPITGFDDDDIQKSIKSLRPSLSRNDGTHNWRIKYDVDDQSEWMANILVVTEDT